MMHSMHNNMSHSHAEHMANMSSMGMGNMNNGHHVTDGSHMNMDHMNKMGYMNNMDHSKHNGSGMDMGMHMEMKMYFHTGISEYLLFEDLHTGSTGAMVGACFAVFVLAILYEGLKFLREILLQRSMREEPRLTYAEKGPNSNNGIQQTHLGSRMLSSGHLLQTFLHIVQVFVSYCLMLIFMTYNVWLCIAVVLGAGVGYFLFGWKRAVIVDANEHCH